MAEIDENKRKALGRAGRILVTGSTGFLGSRIVEAYEEICPVSAPAHGEMDICSLDSVRACLEKEEPQIVIHCAAVSDTGWCQKYPKESRKINVDGTEHLARACREAGARLIFCSSDQVYFGRNSMGEGREPAAHREDEKVDPAGAYGRQKLEAEQRCLEYSRDNICLRLCWMYDRRRRREGEHGNFLTTLLQALREGRELSYPVYDYRGITDAGLVAEKLWQTFRLPGGVYNFGSENSHNMYDTVRLLLEDRGLSTACLQKNETAFAENPRNIRVHMGKARSYGIDFPETLEQLKYSFSISGTEDKSILPVPEPQEG